MILPHEQGRMAWAIKQKNPQLLYNEMTVMADKMPPRPSKPQADLAPVQRGR